MSGNGWAGVANLAGLPSDTLFLSEVIERRDLNRYAVLIFTQCFAVAESSVPGLTKAVQGYLEGGGNVILDGRFAVLDENGKERDHQPLDRLFGLEYGGQQGGDTFRIQVAGVDHYVTRPFDPGQMLSQHLQSAVNIVKSGSAGKVLLQATDGKQSHPFLSVHTLGKSRVAVWSDGLGPAGTTSFFRNRHPQVFYANRVFEAAIRTAHWAAYGDLSDPFPAPQLVNASLAPVVRLDADNSANLDFQFQTFRFLTKLARQTGMVGVYAFVSSSATRAGWDQIAPLAKEYEDVGGQIGTHSKFHRIANDLDEQGWQQELSGSIDEIQSGLSGRGVEVGAIEWFINPGNRIRMKHLEQIARRFSFYMTHGFQEDMPIGFGNITWFTGPHKNLAFFEDTPSPDYQWFYDPNWSYTTAQIAAYQEAVVDHLFHNIGRGAVFNQMWHDYSISSMPA